MKIGVLGGTFDPVHLGHIIMAEEARKSLGLSEVLLVPAGQPMTRSNERITSVEHRLRMLRLAAAGSPHLKVSTVEIERPGPSFTVDTITELRRKYGGKDEIFFILGWDSLAQLPIWREPARIVSMCILVAVPRPGWPQPSLKALEKDIPGIAKRVVFLEKPRVDISATAIREKVAGGESIDHLVPGPVADYIKKHGLYRAEQEVK
jgi:nicotinate-nucleotide adenylyltransferase